MDESLIERDLADDYFKYVPVTLVIHVIGSLLMLWPLQAGHAGVTWFIANATISGALFFAALDYRRHAHLSPNPQRHLNRQALGLFLDGVMWGCAPWFFFSGAPPLGQIYVFATVVVMAIGTTMINAPFPRARLAFCIPALILGGLRALGEGGAQFGAIGAVLLISFPVVVFYGAHWANLLRESVRMRHEKTALVAELTQQKAAAERANLAKTQFFAAASHDLRQPIHALGLFASALRDAEQGREGAVLADKILDNIDVLESLFDELLDIAKIDSGIVTAAPTHFPLSQVYARLNTLHGLEAERDGTTLRFARTTRILYTDAKLLERVLSNLLTNALRFATGGTVLIGARTRGDNVAIEVRDSGPGIAAHEHTRIFEEFTQLNNPERDRRKGLGLGLATVQRLVRIMDAQIEVRSREAHGSTFTVIVPAGVASNVISIGGEQNEPVLNILAGRYVLVIDDEEAIRESMRGVLTGWHCRCMLASSAAEALCASPESPEIVIADYRLREHQTGIQAIHALRAHFGKPIPAILVTGDARPEVSDAARAADIPILAKPVPAARLRSALAHLLACGNR